MKTLRCTIILAMCVFLFGCTATGAKRENMVYRGSQRSYDKDLTHSVEIIGVSGGKDTNPLWTSEISTEAFLGALKASLSKEGLLSDHGKYYLKVRMIKVDQPMLGFDMTVTTHVRYVLTDATDGSIVLDETVIAPYTATVGDAFLGVKRLQLANEGSGKKNIEEFLKELSDLKIQPTEISLVQ